MVYINRIQSKLAKRVYPRQANQRKPFILLHRTMKDRKIYEIKFVYKSPLFNKLIHQPLSGDLATHYNNENKRKDGETTLGDHLLP